MFGRSEQRPGREIDGEPVLKEAPAKSYSQPGRLVSGNGTLALTGHALVFEQRVPRRVVRAPRASIVEVKQAQQAGLRFLPKLLKVTWTTDAGERDSIVLMVKDVDAWVEALG